MRPLPWKGSSIEADDATGLAPRVAPGARRHPGFLIFLRTPLSEHQFWRGLSRQPQFFNCDPGPIATSVFLWFWLCG